MSISLFSLVLIPLAIALSNTGIIGDLFSIGGVSIRMEDMLTIALAARYGMRKLKTIANKNDKERLKNEKVIQATSSTLILLLAILYTATVIAGLRYDFTIFALEITPLTRFTIQASLFFIVSALIGSEITLKECHRKFLILGFLVVGSAFISFALYTLFGIQFGEVQETSQTLRFFGPLGDQLGFIVSLFCFYFTLKSNINLALLSGFAVAMTATRGAILALVIGFLFLTLEQKRRLKFRISAKVSKKIFLSFYLLVVSIAFLSFSSIGNEMLNSVFQTFNVVISRFIDSSIGESGLTQRSITLSMATSIFMNNFFTGVGYTGFKHIALNEPEYQLIPNYIDAQNAIATTNNQFLQFATDAGIFGLILFVGLMIASLNLLKYAGNVAPREQKALFIAVRIWLLSQIFGNVGASWMLPSSFISSLYWIFLAMAAATVKIYGFTGKQYEQEQPQKLENELII